MDPGLYLGAASGDEAIFENFSSDELLKETPEKNSVLHVATLHKQRHIAEKILQSHGSLLFHKNSDGDTPLHVASRIGCQEIAKLLIDHGRIGDTVAVVSGQKMVLKLMHINGDEFDHPKIVKMVNRKKDSALHDAVRSGHLSVVELLIDEDCELTLVTNSSGESPLFLAVERKLFDIAKHLLHSTDKCSFAGRDGMNALHAAVVYLHNLDSSSSDSELHGGETAPPNFNCNYSKLHGIVKDIVRKCPNAVGEQDNFGWTSLHYAAHYGVEEVVKYFVTNNKSAAYKKDKAGMSAFHIAAKRGEVGIMEMISTFCPEICELSTSNGQTALHVAVKSGKKNAVDFLLKALGSNAVLNKQDKDGDTPLHLAAVLEDYEILITLLNDERLDGNAVNKDGLTAMDITLSCKELEESQKLDIISKLKSLGGFPSLKEQLSKRNAEMQDIIETTKNPQPQPQPHNSADHKANRSDQEEKKHDSLGQLFKILVNPSNSKRAAEVDLLLATLIATVTFAAAFQVPGGYESDGPYMGLPILRHKSLFKVFIIFDSLAFGLSSSSIFLHFLASMGPNKADNVNYALRNAQLTTFYSILAMVATFMSAIHLVSGNSGGIKAAVYVCITAFFIGFLYTVLENWAHKVPDANKDEGSDILT